MHVKMDKRIKLDRNIYRRSKTDEGMSGGINIFMAK
jgi:hypothetical protein